MSYSFTVGCDPEVFVTKDGKPISAHDLIPGNKKAPHKVLNGAIQPDGLAAEFNTDAVPYSDFVAFDKNIVTVLKTLKDTLPEGYNLHIEPSTEFDKDYYDSLPESAKELGCDPDYCAYSEDPFEPNKRPDGSAGVRSAAGHIHIGWGSDIPVDHPDHIEVCRKFIRCLDLYVGLAMTVFDTDTRRRTLYGAAGAYRPKSYGVEYRTPSNAWIKNKARRQFIHTMLRSCIQTMSGGTDYYESYFGETSKYKDAYTKNYGHPRDIINNGDAKAARRILVDMFGFTVPTLEALNK